MTGTVMLLIALMCYGSATQEPPMFADFDPADVVEIELVQRVEGKAEVTRLRRRGSYWYLPEFHNFPAEPLYVTMLLEQIDKLPQGRVVATDKSRHKGFGLGPDHMKLVFRDDRGKVCAQLLVGRHGENYREVHVREPGNDAVRLVGSDLYMGVHRPMWTKRVIQRMQPQLLSRVVVTGSGLDFTAAKGADNRWELVSPANRVLSSGFADRLAPALAYLRGGRVARMSREQTPVHLTVRQHMAGAELVLYLSRDDKGLWVRRGDEPFVFRLDHGFWDLIAGATAAP